MRKTTKDQTAPRPAPRRASDDPLVDYLAVSVSRTASGQVSVRRMKMDTATRRLVNDALFEGHEPRTSAAAMGEHLARGAAEHLLDLEEQLRLW